MTILGPGLVPQYSCFGHLKVVNKAPHFISVSIDSIKVNATAPGIYTDMPNC